MWETLFGGDQLSLARARGAVDIRDDHGILEDKLHGLFPVVKDWHTKIALQKVP